MAQMEVERLLFARSIVCFLCDERSRESKVLLAGRLLRLTLVRAFRRQGLTRSGGREIGRELCSVATAADPSPGPDQLPMSFYSDSKAGQRALGRITKIGPGVIPRVWDG